MGYAWSKKSKGVEVPLQNTASPARYVRNLIVLHRPSKTLGADQLRVSFHIEKLVLCAPVAAQWGIYANI